jgi:serine/threonine protein kinase
LGVGASASVFEVIRKRDNRRFAVKAFSKGNLNKEPRLRQGLLNEIKILRILSEESHENVLTLHEIYES